MIIIVNEKKMRKHKIFIFINEAYFEIKRDYNQRDYNYNYKKDETFLLNQNYYYILHTTIQVK